MIGPTSPQPAHPRGCGLAQLSPEPVNVLLDLGTQQRGFGLPVAVAQGPGLVRVKLRLWSTAVGR